jgi:hypothetical protein
VIVVMSRRVMGIKNFNSCQWSGGNKTPGVNLVIKCRKKFYMYLCKQILSWFSLVRIQFYLSWASGKWVSMKTV